MALTRNKKQGSYLIRYHDGACVRVRCLGLLNARRQGTAMVRLRRPRRPCSCCRCRARPAALCTRHCWWPRTASRWARRPCSRVRRSRLCTQARPSTTRWTRFEFARPSSSSSSVVALTGGPPAADERTPPAGPQRAVPRLQVRRHQVPRGRVMRAPMQTSVQSFSMFLVMRWLVRCMLRRVSRPPRKTPPPQRTHRASVSSMPRVMATIWSFCRSTSWPMSWAMRPSVLQRDASAAPRQSGAGPSHFTASLMASTCWSVRRGRAQPRGVGGCRPLTLHAERHTHAVACGSNVTPPPRHAANEHAPAPALSRCSADDCLLGTLKSEPWSSPTVLRLEPGDGPAATPANVAASGGGASHARTHPRRPGSTRGCRGTLRAAERGAPHSRAGHLWSPSRTPPAVCGRAHRTVAPARSPAAVPAPSPHAHAGTPRQPRTPQTITAAPRVCLGTQCPGAGIVSAV